MEKIHFSYSLAVLLAKELEKKNVYKKVSVFDESSCAFSQEELDLIEELTLDNVSGVENLEYLRNLKKLTLKSAEYSRYSDEVDIKASCFVNCIEDFRPVEKLVNLEELTIVNDITIKTLDLTNLMKLKNLKLINNPCLEELKGLETLQNLTNVMIYGTSIHSDFDILKYIRNTEETEVNILDVNMYLAAVKSDEEIPEIITNAVVTGESQLCFAELVGLMDHALIDVQSMARMYSKADLIFKLFDVYGLEADDQVRFIYDFIIDKTVIDFNAIANRDKKYTDYITKYSEIPAFAKQKLAMIHSSYNAFITKKTNCEGIVNLMKFMLTMLNVRSFNVHCIDARHDVNGLPNHSMIRVLQNGTWYYYDPSLIESKPYLFYEKTYEEIKALGFHKLNAFEASVNKEMDNVSYRK